MLVSTCSERGSISSSHGKAKKELQDMAEAMKVRLAGEPWRNLMTAENMNSRYSLGHAHCTGSTPAAMFSRNA